MTVRARLSIDPAQRRIVLEVIRARGDRASEPDAEPWLSARQVVVGRPDRGPRIGRDHLERDAVIDGTRFGKSRARNQLDACGRNDRADDRNREHRPPAQRAAKDAEGHEKTDKRDEQRRNQRAALAQEPERREDDHARGGSRAPPVLA